MDRITFKTVSGESCTEITLIFVRGKDYLLALSAGKTPQIETMLMPAHFVAETVRANVLFREMQRSRAHIVIVLDEYGGTSGLVTLEDLIEEVLGDIYDENEIAEAEKIQILGDHHWKIRGSADLEEVAELLGLSKEEDMEEFNTFGGWLLSKQPFLPVHDLPPDIILGGYCFKVLSMHDRRIHWVEVKRSGNSLEKA